MIYLDNASTSFPKPPQVVNAIADYLNNFAVSPGRGTHFLSQRAEEIVIETRQILADMLHISNKDHVILCNNATHALNMAIKGSLGEGDHALTCNYSHNSVLRPLESLARKNVISYDVFQIDSNGMLDQLELESMIQSNTKMIIVNYASNVIGVKAPIHLISDICKKYQILFLLDVTQAIVYEEINVSKIYVDFIAGTGHKSLLGPTGSGFLYVRDADTIIPLMEGGSGGISSISPIHPKLLPYKLEAGTPNMLSIVGLHAGLSYICKQGRQNLANHSLWLTKYLWQKLSCLPEITLYGSSNFNDKVPLLSFTVNSLLTSELAYMYDQKYGICIRSGIHCAPQLHKYLGTSPTGTIRVSPGVFNTEEHIDEFIIATKKSIYGVKYGKVSTR